MKWLVLFIAVFRSTIDAFNYDFDYGSNRYANSHYPNIDDHSQPSLFHPVSNEFYYNPPMDNTFRTFPLDYNANRFVPLSYCSHQRIYPENAPYYNYNSHPTNYDADVENEHIVANGFEMDITDQSYVGSPYYSTYNSYPQKYNADTDDKHIVGIVNGFETDITDQPYQVGLMYKKIFKCGGSIISPKHILTAAHCYKKKRVISKYSVLVGTNDILNKNHQGVVALVKNFIVHPSYNHSDPAFKNDIAVMLLHKPLPVDGKRIATISLPKQDQPLPIGQMGTVSGWGIKSYESTADVHTLNAVHLPILEDRQCVKSYKQDFTSKLFFCAGYLEGTKDSCSGDSGGPFVVDKVLWGIVSFGRGCAMVGYAGIYTNVANYRKWIDEICFSSH